MELPKEAGTRDEALFRKGARFNVRCEAEMRNLRVPHPCRAVCDRVGTLIVLLSAESYLTSSSNRTSCGIPFRSMISSKNNIATNFFISSPQRKFRPHQYGNLAEFPRIPKAPSPLVNIRLTCGLTTIHGLVCGFGLQQLP